MAGKSAVLTLAFVRKWLAHGLSIAGFIVALVILCIWIITPDNGESRFLEMVFPVAVAVPIALLPSLVAPRQTPPSAAHLAGVQEISSRAKDLQRIAGRSYGNYRPRIHGGRFHEHVTQASRDTSALLDMCDSQESLLGPEARSAAEDYIEAIDSAPWDTASNQTEFEEALKAPYARLERELHAIAKNRSRAL